MAVQIHPTYHTLSMLKLLRAQGSTQIAVDLAEQMLRQDPQNAALAELHEALKRELEAAFARFQEGAQRARAKNSQE